MEQTKLLVKCAWCQKDMGEKDGRGQTGVSHGLCAECAIDLRLLDRGLQPACRLDKCHVCGLPFMAHGLDFVHVGGYGEVPICSQCQEK